MNTVIGERINFDVEGTDYRDTIFVNCKIAYFFPKSTAENCEFEDCEFEQRIVGKFNPHFMQNCEIKNCLFESNIIQSAHVNGQDIKYKAISNDAIEVINSKRSNNNSLANSEKFLVDEGYEGIRGGLSIIFDRNQYPELDSDNQSSPSNIGMVNFRLLNSPDVEDCEIYYYFDGLFKEITEDYLPLEECFTKEDIQMLNDTAKKCYAQTISILNSTIGKNLDWNLTFEGYQIDSENFVSVWAYDSETNVIYQKCQMAYPT